MSKPEYEFVFDPEKCWYKNGHCNLYNTSDCNRTCLRYVEMHYLMYQSRIPEFKQQPFSLTPEQADLEAFMKLNDIKNNIKEFVDNHQSLFIHGSNCGNGKTSWAIKIMQSYFDKIWYGNQFRCRGLFLFIPSFIRDVKQSINHPTQQFTELLENIKVADIVIWDDVGAVKLSEYDYNTLLGYMDDRIQEGKTNIYTSNLTYELLINNIGPRLTSRIYNGSVSIELVGRDWRGGNS